MGHARHRVLALDAGVDLAGPRRAARHRRGLARLGRRALADDLPVHAARLRRLRATVAAAPGKRAGPRRGDDHARLRGRRHGLRAAAGGDQQGQPQRPGADRLLRLSDRRQRAAERRAGRCRRGRPASGCRVVAVRHRHLRARRRRRPVGAPGCRGHLAARHGLQRRLPAVAGVGRRRRVAAARPRAAAGSEAAPRASGPTPPCWPPPSRRSACWPPTSGSPCRPPPSCWLPSGCSARSIARATRWPRACATR